jgi:hypothetical protein
MVDEATQSPPNPRAQHNGRKQDGEYVVRRPGSGIQGKNEEATSRKQGEAYLAVIPVLSWNLHCQRTERAKSTRNGTDSAAQCFPDPTEYTGNEGRQAEARERRDFIRNPRAS